MASGERCIQAIDKASTITPTSSNQRRSTSMSIDDADQLTNNTAAAEAFNETMLRHLTVEENSKTPKQREDHDSGLVDLTTSQRATGHGFKIRPTSGFSDPVFGQTSTPSQHSSFTSGSSPKFDKLASNTQSFGDLAKSGGTAFGNDTSMATLQFGTSDQPIREFGSKFHSDANRFTNNKTVDAPNKTVSSNFTTDGNYQNLKKSGDKSQGQEISTNITTITKGKTNFQSTFGTSECCRPVLRPSAASKRDSSSSRSEGADGIPRKENVGQNVLATTQVISDATIHANALIGNQGAKSFRFNGSSQTASFPGGKFSSESVGGVGSRGFGISQHQEQSTSEFCSRADGYNGQVDPTTNTTTTQGVNRFTSGFAQPKFGQAANPHQQVSSYNNNRSESLVQASDLRTFGDVAQSSGSTLGSGSTFATPALGTSGFENPSGSGGSTFGSGPSFTGYRS